MPTGTYIYANALFTYAHYDIHTLTYLGFVLNTHIKANTLLRVQASLSCTHHVCTYAHNSGFLLTCALIYNPYTAHRHTHTRTHTHAHIHINTYIHAHIHIQKRLCTRARSHAHKQKRRFQYIVHTVKLLRHSNTYIAT